MSAFIRRDPLPVFETDNHVYAHDKDAECETCYDSGRVLEEIVQSAVCSPINIVFDDHEGYEDGYWFP